MENYQEISDLVWKSVDRVLRDHTHKRDYGEFILPFVVMRRFDCVLEEQKELIIETWNDLIEEGIKDPSNPVLNKIHPKKFFNRSKYDLTSLSKDSQNIRENFNLYIEGYSENVKEILVNFKIDEKLNFLNKQEILLEFVQEFCEIDLSLEKIDNQNMGLIYEEINNKFCEEKNKDSGEYFTPRDIVELLVNLIFLPEKEELNKPNLVRSLYDPCCGTGGMLTQGRKWINENLPNDIVFKYCGQELTPETHSICLSDFLILDENPDLIVQGSTLSSDGFKDQKFYYMISNPPFGTHWGTEKKKLEFKQELDDPEGPYSNGTPSVMDSQSLFMMKLISKMEPRGSRVGVITSGSPLFNDEPSNSSKNLSDFRKWLVDRDLIETIIKLPKGLFFDTDIHTYIWILSNKKPSERQNKVQLINGVDYSQRLGRSLNKKTYKIDDESREKIIDLYMNMTDKGDSKIIDSRDFLYKRITFNYKIKDKKKNEFDRIDLNVNSEEFFNEKIKSFLPTSELEPKKERIGCEITFNKYFYEYEKPKETNVWLSEIRDIEKEISKVTSEVLDDQ